MLDILGCVYDFVLAYAWRNDDAPQLDAGQIIRGWQNTGTLPQDTSEFCVITLLRTEPHGKPVECPQISADDFAGQVAQLVEHVVQIDFCSAEPFVLPQVTKLRADLIMMAAGSRLAAGFFKDQSPLLNCMWAEGAADLSFLDNDKLYTARYMCTLHISEIQYSNIINQPSFNSVHLHVENVDTHHKTKD